MRYSDKSNTESYFSSFVSEKPYLEQAFLQTCAIIFKKWSKVEEGKQKLDKRKDQIFFYFITLIKIILYTNYITNYFKKPLFMSRKRKFPIFQVPFILEKMQT